MLDTADEAVNGNQASFSLKIKLPDKETYLYKTTLVALLNSSPDGKLSKDRLTRVQSSSNPSQSLCVPSAIDAVNFRKTIGLYSDIAVLRKDSEGNHYFILSRVQCMIKKSGKRGKIEYRNPIDDKCNDIEIVAGQYEHRQDNDYEYCLGKGHRMQLTYIDGGCADEKP